VSTIIRAVRDGKLCQLVQGISPRGIPCCLNCLKPIPLHYRSYRKYPLFCTNRCAIAWAQWVGGQVYPSKTEEA